MKGIIYTRVSSDEQVRGTSLDFQEEICRGYCKEKGIEVLEVFREEGASAKTADRAELLRAIEFCRKNKGKLQAFVVAKVDRFARNTEDHFYVRKLLLDYGATLHSVTEPIGNNPAEKFIETVLAGTAEFDNAIRRQRCIDGMMTKINQGLTPWKPPIGYKCLGSKKRGEKKNEPDHPDHQTFPIIQMALREFSKGIYSQTELAKKLDEWGLKTFRGKKTHFQLVERMVKKYLKFYAGILVNPWTQEEKEGLHQPMITKEEMFKIQCVVSGKSTRVRRGWNNPTFPLRKFVFCALCGRPLTGSLSRGRSKKYAYYHCYNKECSAYSKAIPKDDFESKFLEALGKVTPKQKFLSVFKETVIDLWQEKKHGFELTAKKYERQLAMLEEKRKKIFEMREDGSYSKEEFQERREETDNQIVAVKISLSETRIDQFDIEGVLNFATNFIADLPRQWFDLSPETRVRFQKRVFPEGIPYKRDFGFGTARLGFIYELNRQSANSNTHMVALAGIEPALPH